MPTEENDAMMLSDLLLSKAIGKNASIGIEGIDEKWRINREREESAASSELVKFPFTIFGAPSKS